jgi:hypothetical protein
VDGERFREWFSAGFCVGGKKEKKPNVDRLDFF